MAIFVRKMLGDILISLGAMTPAEVDLIIGKMESSGLRFGETAIQEGIINADVLAQALAEQFRLPYVDIETCELDGELLSSITSSLFLKYNFLPIRRDADQMLIAVADPTNVTALDELELTLDCLLQVQVASAAKIKKFIERGDLGSKKVLSEVSEDFKLQLVKETDKGEEVLSIEKLTADTSPIIRLIDSTLYDALNKRASDIHIETNADGVIFKYRVDGVLFKATEQLDGRFQGPIISRIKVMSELDISERRIPQDGRFKVRLGGKSIDFRVSIMPSIFGEDAVIRILDKESIANDLQGLTLESLGFTSHELVRFRRMVREPYGMVLVTGPTGSGKTTTLYAALSEINSDEEKIITIEDPVEYQVKGVVQIPVNEKKGLTFARGLRSILRHDPDKIMVGEIRDPETAQIAVQSALTGHLVFTTVHANNVFDVLGRFLHMGIDAYNFVSCLNCVAAQRLVRRNCPHCTKPVKYDRKVLEESGLSYKKYGQVEFMAGEGCEECHGTGFHGRSAIMELLDMNDELRELIVAKAPVSQLKQAARKSGTVFLRDAAIEKLVQGLTTLPEINRVTFVEQAME